MRRLLWLLLILLVAGCSTGPGAVAMTTRSSRAPGAKLTVLHVGAPWCPPCVAMEPAVHKFEEDWKGRVNFVNINSDQTSTPEFEAHRDLLSNVEAIPYTAWLDAHGKVLGEKVGYADAQELARLSESYLTAASSALPVTPTGKAY